MQDAIVHRITELVKQEMLDFSGDLGQIEHAVFTTMMHLGGQVLQHLVNEEDTGSQGSSPWCPSCNGRMRFMDYRSKQFHSIFGWITVSRRYYHCKRCGTRAIPYDAQRGLGEEKLTPGLANWCCLLSVDDSFESSSRKLASLLGQQVSDKTIERVVHQIGTDEHKEQSRQTDHYFKTHTVAKAPHTPKRLYVAADGTTVHETDGWHEVKQGVIWWEDETFQVHKYYVGGFARSETFGWQLWLQACRSGLLEAQEVVFLGDGAGWLKHIKHQHFKGATFILDWYHAIEHLWDCGKVLFGEGSEATKQWVKKREDWLWEGKLDKLLSDLCKQQRRSRGRKRQALVTLIRYIRNNRAFMDYAAYRRKGYTIGSGAVEGACKYVVGKRLKQSGMIWSRQGASAVLALRLAWLNNQWEQLWSRKPLAA